MALAFDLDTDAEVPPSVDSPSGDLKNALREIREMGLSAGEAAPLIARALNQLGDPSADDAQLLRDANRLAGPGADSEPVSIAWLQSLSRVAARVAGGEPLAMVARQADPVSFGLERLSPVDPQEAQRERDLVKELTDDPMFDPPSQAIQLPAQAAAPAAPAAPMASAASTAPPRPRRQAS
jgi:hypothetical protein